MKFRLLDTLQCECGKSNLIVKNLKTRRHEFNYVLTEPRCHKWCGYKQCSIEQGNITTPELCMECYTQEIIEGTIMCECGREFRIVNGIPRFLPKEMETDFEKIQKTFSYEWKMFKFGERNWGQDIEFRKKLFLKGMGVSKDDLKGKLIFDAGCGSGLLSMAMADSFGMEVIAMDLATGIEKAHKHNTSPYVHFIQGSVLEPPIRDGVADFVYCAGVLIALPDTKTGFKVLPRCLKQGGRYFIWVYHPIDRQHHPKDLLKMKLYNWIRANITSRLPIKVQYLVYLTWIVPFLLKQKVYNIVLETKDTRTWREKMQGFVDMFSPIYQHRHTEEEVIEWFNALGFVDATVAYQEQYGFAARGDNPGTDRETRPASG